MKKCNDCKWKAGKACVVLGTVRPANATEDKDDPACHWQPSKSRRRKTGKTVKRPKK